MVRDNPTPNPDLGKGAAVKRKHLRFGRGFRIALANPRAQAAEMVLSPGAVEGDSENRHRGADQWLFVISGSGSARVNGKRYALSPGTLMLIEHGDEHQIRNTGRRPLRTLNLYVPPAYTSAGDELPAGKP
jgi:mannose-6-phosphate isomerase-like protein (cupin superfamily)